MASGPYAPFIIASYAIAIGVVVGLVVWVLADYRRQRRILAELEARGIKRRSSPREEPR